MKIELEMIKVDKNPICVEMGWYFVILKPSNWEECEKYNYNYMEWIQKFGVEKAWFGNGEFHRSQDTTHPYYIITDRVLYYAPADKISFIDMDIK